MDLFVVNRYGEDDSKPPEDEEKAKLAQVLRKIEKRKAQRERKKLQKTALTLRKASAAAKKAVKTGIVPVPDNDIVDAENEEIQEPAGGEKPHKRKKRGKVAEGFTILGAESLAKRPTVKRVLPRWLKTPTVISSDLQQLTVRVRAVKDLDRQLRGRLKANGVQFLFPVQAAVIPHLLRSHRHGDIVFPRDVCVSAPTGSGKTLAYVLPIVQALKEKATTKRKVYAVVVLPTRELAVQVFRAFKSYCEGTDVEVRCVTGSHSFAEEQKQLVVKGRCLGYFSKTDILVCTPGKLVDHLKSTEGFSLRHLEYLVIDEADRLLENVQNDWLYHLEKHIHSDDPYWNPQTGRLLTLLSLKGRRPPQKLLFSATLSQDPEKLQQLRLFQPILFTCTTESSPEFSATNGRDDGNAEAETFIGKYTTPNELTERYTVCSSELKPLVLYEFIRSRSLKKTLVFTHSIESAHRLKILMSSLCENELEVEEMSSSLKVHSRDEVIARFSRGEVNILISTDSMARGIDFPGVECVVSYSAPKFIKTYIHRAGRTARAGDTGLALTILLQKQLSDFKKLLEQAKKSGVTEVEISEEALALHEVRYQKAVGELGKTVTSEDKVQLKRELSLKRTFKAKKRRLRAMKARNAE